MLYLGFLLTSLGAALCVYGWCETLRKRDREYSATIALLVYLRGAMNAERRTPAAAIIRFTEKNGADGIPWLLRPMNEEEMISFMRGGALRESESAILAEDKEALAAFLLSLGRAELDEERRRLDGIIERLEKSGGELRSRTDGRVKSAWVLFASAAAGALLMMV